MTSGGLPTGGGALVSGGGAVGASPVTETATIVDDFERSAGSFMDPYSGDTGTWSLSTAEVINGSQSATADASGAGFISSQPGDGLANYIPQGSVSDVFFRKEGSNGAMFFYFRFIDQNNYFRIDLDFNDSNLEFWERDGGTLSRIAADFSVSYSANQWYDIELTIDDGTLGGSANDLTVDLFEYDAGASSRGTNLATLSVNNSLHAGNEGFQIFADGSSGDSVWVDFINRSV